MWTWDRIAQWSRATRKGEVIGETSLAPIAGFSIDTRTLKADEIFIALRGTQSDGHHFIAEAFKKGAAGAMVSRSWFSESAASTDFTSRGFIVVEETLKGLQALATWHRRQFSIPVVGITGSNGKTTTKEMLASILGYRTKVLKTQGNLNNAIGLPLTLLQLASEDKAAVLEMGISQQGEMRTLCEMAQPTMGVITHIGSAHLEFLGDLQGVAREKQVLFDLLPASGTVIINRDDPYLAARTESVRAQWTYAVKQDADVTASEIKQNAGILTFTLRLNRPGEGGGMQKIALSLLGTHQVYNAIAASAAALALGYGFDDIREGLRRVHPVPLRGEILEMNGATILLDAYNANPTSVQAALSALAAFPPPPSPPSRKVAILGDMLELGAFAEEGHRQVGRSVADHRIDRLIAVGQWSRSIAYGAEEGGMKAEAISTCATLDDLDLQKEIKPGDVVLIKGSRGMAMEKILNRDQAHAV